MKTTYCVSCRKNTGNNNNGRLMMKSNYNVCGNEKSRFISKSEGSGLLSSLGIRTPLSKIPGLNILF